MEPICLDEIFYSSCHFVSAHEICQDQANFYFQLSRVQAKLGAFDAAIKSAEEAVALAPEKVNFKNNLKTLEETRN